MVRGVGRTYYDSAPIMSLDLIISFHFRVCKYKQTRHLVANAAAMRIVKKRKHGNVPRFHSTLYSDNVSRDCPCDDCVRL